jgi:hypothetical protein
MDKLEEHIMKNRENLDRYLPPSGIWKRISRSIGTEKSNLRKWFSIAAMVIVIFGTALVLLKPGYNWSDSKRSMNKDSGLDASNPQLKETELYYNNLVNSLYKEATPLLTGNPEIKKELNADFSQIDSICTEIKKDLKDNVANQDVIEALIQNYRIKIRLLEEMLIILKEGESNPEKSKNYEL